MIPSNQFWFNSGANTQYNYYLNPLNLNVDAPKMDGVGLVSYNNKLITTGGWNPTVGVFTPGPNTNKQWESTDDGKNYTEVATALFTPRHVHFSLVLNNKIFIGGGSGNAVIPLKDVWSYDTINGWVQTTADWGAGVGNRYFTTSCVHNGKILIAGGQDNPSGTTMFTDIWETADGVTFTKLCDLPAALTHFSSGVIYSFNNKLYLVGGSKYAGGSNTDINNHTYVSDNNGTTWASLGTVPIPMTGIFQNGCVWDDKMWYLCGSQSGINIKGLYHSTDGITWTPFYDAPSARHATGMTVHNDKLIFFTGNFWNDSWCIQKEVVRPIGYISPLLQTWYNSLIVKTSPALTTKLSVFMDGLNSDGVLADSYLIAPVGFGLETNEQRLRPLKTTSGDDLVAVNFLDISSSGITGNGSNSYVDLKWNASIDAINTQNSLSIAIWVESDTAENKIEMGLYQGLNQSFLSRKQGDNNVYYSLNDSSNAFVAFNDAPEYYFYSVNRSNVTKRQFVRGPEVVIDNITPSVPVTNLDFYGCCANGAGTPTFFSTKEQRLFFIGNGAARTWQLRQRLKYLDLP
jgi:N-acetylneuraminic acid mutarotase